MKTKTLVLIISLITSAFVLPQSKGKLVIVGGVQTREIAQKFVELAGGENARIIIIPNAGSRSGKWSRVQAEGV